VRARNVASFEPSDWSEALQVKTEAEEKASLANAKPSNAACSSRRDLAATLERKSSVAGTTAEVGMAVVTQIDLGDLLGLKHVLPDPAGMAEWSPFRRTIGEFFNECSTMALTAHERTLSLSLSHTIYPQRTLSTPSSAQCTLTALHCV